ncbi:hypothetical protein [Methanocorpusculum bavaricum]|uniref:hypothetical protein n=1 Tax=Methanocorpusculum bavaricum TaxID=71518 RepID=UPI001B7F9C1D|nr:hypothetical protein [Methanocorpusculum bavaricum]
MICIQLGYMDPKNDEITGIWHADQEYADGGMFFQLTYVFADDGTVSEFWYDSGDGTLKRQYDLFWERDTEGEYTLNDGNDFRKYTIAEGKLCDVYFELYYHREK